MSKAQCPIFTIGEDLVQAPKEAVIAPTLELWGNDGRAFNDSGKECINVQHLLGVSEAFRIHLHQYRLDAVQAKMDLKVAEKEKKQTQ